MALMNLKLHLLIRMTWAIADVLQGRRVLRPDIAQALRLPWGLDLLPSLQRSENPMPRAI
jgi:hypothetical protein